MKLNLQPLSSTTIAPASMGGKPVTQLIHLENPTQVRPLREARPVCCALPHAASRGPFSGPSQAPVRIRFKLTGRSLAREISEQGELANVPVPPQVL